MKKVKMGKLSTAILLGLAATTAVAEPKVEIGGVVEVELSSGKDETGTKSSDLALATVELGISAEINDRVSGNLVVLHEDDDTENFVIDEGTITITGGEGSNWSVTAGRMYIPFGNFETNMVSDPLTLEIAETQEAAIRFDFSAGDINAAVYAFNGDADETATNPDVIDDFGISISYANDNLDVGVDFINNVAETDGLWGVVDGVIGGSPSLVTEQAQGIAFHAIYKTGSFTVIAEMVSADKLVDANNAEPKATNFEVAYDLGNGTVALGFQSTDDLGGTLPESKTMLAYSTTIAKDVSLAVEYADAEDYPTTATPTAGTGQSGGTFTAQIAVEF